MRSSSCEGVVSCSCARPPLRPCVRFFALGRAERVRADRDALSELLVEIVMMCSMRVVECGARRAAVYPQRLCESWPEEGEGSCSSTFWRFGPAHPRGKVKLRETT